MILWKAIRDFLNDKNYRQLLFASIITLAFGTIIFHLVEGWRIIDSLYFCVITLTTIGYGDITPQTDLGKIFNMIYILIGLGLILTFIKTVYEHYDETRKKVKNKN